jgi:hypothetical protein
MIAILDYGAGNRHPYFRDNGHPEAGSGQIWAGRGIEPAALQFIVL